MGVEALTGFDPVALGRHECAAWVGYYRRDWRLVLRSALGMVRSGFGLSRPQAVRAAWYVLRANQAWAPVPDNDPERARVLMARFYALVARVHDLPLEPGTAAALEVAWWHEHRVLQRGPVPDPDDTPLVEALTALYAYVYATAPDVVRPAAALRARAMRVSDAWVASGCDPADPGLREERRLLVAGYTGLRAATERVRS